MESIIAALITGGLAFLATAITVRSQNSKSRSEIAADLKKQQQKIESDLAKHEAVSKERIETLTKEVEKHNGVIERTYKLEKDVSNLFHRFEDMQAHTEKIPHIEERAEAAHRRIDRAGIDTKE